MAAPKQHGLLRTWLNGAAKLAGFAPHDEAQEEDDRLECKGTLLSATTALDAKSEEVSTDVDHPLPGFGQGFEGIRDEHLATVYSYHCTGLAEPDGCGVDWEGPGNSEYSEALTFRIFPASASVKAMKTAVHEHLAWLVQHDNQPPGRAGDVAAAAPAPADTHFQCDFSCASEPMADATACGQGFSSRCSMAMTSDRYALDYSFQSMCTDDAVLILEGNVQQCNGELMSTAQLKLLDKADSDAAKQFGLGVIDGGPDTMAPLVNGEWAGFSRAQMPLP